MLRSKHGQVGQIGGGMQINTGKAKDRFSELINLLVSHQEEEIIIANRGEPVVKMVLYDMPPVRQAGLAKGRVTVPDDLDASNDEIAEMFGV